MEKYEQLRKHCAEHKILSEKLIDNFLVYYSALKNRTDIEFDARFKPFKEFKKQMPKPWPGTIKGQYMCHRIFRKNGLIHKYLQHAAVKELTTEEKDHLRMLASHPWRFCFSEINSNPAPDFYEMEDVFTGESFLLHSKSVTQILTEQPVMLWFNLILFNGKCWETTGTVAGLQTFAPDDIFFYATEVNDAIGSDEDLLEDLENNPVPYMLLYAGAMYPLLVEGNVEVMHVIGEAPAPAFTVEAARKQFIPVRVEGLITLTHKKWSAPPWKAEAYYDEAKKQILIASLSRKGYDSMVKSLKKCGIDFPDEPDVCVHLPIILLIEDVLKKKVVLDPYESLRQLRNSTVDDRLPEIYPGEMDPVSNSDLQKFNKLLELAIPFINDDAELDIEMLAKKSGLDVDVAADILSTVMGARKGKRKNK